MPAIGCAKKMAVLDEKMLALGERVFALEEHMLFLIAVSWEAFYFSCVR